MRRKEVLTFVIAWMNLEDTMLSKISQTQKHRYCLISLIWNLKKKKKDKSKNGDFTRGGSHGELLLKE